MISDFTYLTLVPSCTNYYSFCNDILFQTLPARKIESNVYTIQHYAQCIYELAHLPWTHNFTRAPVVLCSYNSIANTLTLQIKIHFIQPLKTYNVI